MDKTSFFGRIFRGLKNFFQPSPAKYATETASGSFSQESQSEAGKKAGPAFTPVSSSPSTFMSTDTVDEPRTEEGAEAATRKSPDSEGDESAANPLLEPFSTPNQAPPFHLARAEHFMPALEEAIRQARENIEAIKNNPEDADFDNTIVALEGASELLDQISRMYYHLFSVVGSDDIVALSNQIPPLLTDFSMDLILDAELFARVKTVYDKMSDSSDLTSEQSMLLKETYRAFAQEGSLLETEEEKARLREIKKRLSVLSSEFSTRATKSTEKFVMFLDREEDLAGLPETAIEAAKEKAVKKGEPDKWLFTLDQPSYAPFMQFADNRSLREKLCLARTNTAYKDEFDNCSTIIEILALRQEKAQLLGYKTHADCVLENRMAADTKAVESLLDTLRTGYKKAALQDLQQLKDYAREVGGPEDLKPWDIAYYGEKLKQELFSFSSEDLRPYLPLDCVLKGAFNHASKLFGIRFEKSEDYPVWHEDVTAYNVYDEQTGKFLSSFYTDFHPREGKKSGAWMFTLRSQGLYKGKVERPIVGIVCNFTRATKNRPALLTHSEVVTLFHEMGHAIHGMVSDVTYSSLAGTRVKRDFVELPSQLQESWCYEKETFDMFASHYETGEKIPPDLFDRLCQTKRFMSGLDGLRQVSLASLDMRFHTAEAEMIQDVAAFEKEAMADSSVMPQIGGPISTSFSHIFAGGYSAGYYSYKWAEVLSADAFEAFKEKGIYDQETARAFMEEVLKKGGTVEPAQLYRNFRGRDADPAALMRQEGLEP